MERCKPLGSWIHSFHIHLSLLWFSSPVVSDSLGPPWTAARKASLSLPTSWSLPKSMFIALVIPSSHLIPWRPGVKSCSLFILRSSRWLPPASPTPTPASSSWKVVASAGSQALCFILEALIHPWRPEITDGCESSCPSIWQEIFSFHMSDSLRSLGMLPARLLCPWNFPGKNTGVGCHFLL